MEYTLIQWRSIHRGNRLYMDIRTKSSCFSHTISHPKNSGSLFIFHGYCGGMKKKDPK